MKIKEIILALCMYACIGLHAQTLPVDSTDFRSMVRAARQEPKLDKKIALYHTVAQHPQFKTEPDFGVYVSSIQGDIAMAYAEEKNVSAFLQWSAQIQALRVRNNAIGKGYELLSDGIPGSELEALLSGTLDSLLQLQPLADDDLNLFSKVTRLYWDGAQKGNLNKAQALHYTTIWYNAQGGYFSTDIAHDFSKDPGGIPASLSYAYAKRLLDNDDQEGTFRVLAKAVETRAFTLDQLLVYKEEFSAITDLEQRIQAHLDSITMGYADRVQKLLQKNTQTGQPLDQSTLKDKYIVLDFWGSWCLPCRFSHPKLKELYAIYKDRGLEMISVAHEPPNELEKTKNIWKKAIEQDKMDWVQILNNEDKENFDAVRSFAIGVFPTKILLDAQFNKIAVYEGTDGTDLLKAKLKELFD